MRQPPYHQIEDKKGFEIPGQSPCPAGSMLVVEMPFCFFFSSPFLSVLLPSTATLSPSLMEVLDRDQEDGDHEGGDHERW